MKKERMEAHKRALAKRYGIERIESFIISARRHQAVLERISIAFCNDESLSDDKKYRRMEIRQEREEKSALECLAKYCRYHKKFRNEFRINSDPRGCALKIEAGNLDQWIVKDWGGYGIIAPDKNDY